MIEFLFEYGMFLAKAVTIVVSIVAVLILILGLSRKAPIGGGLLDEEMELADAEASAAELALEGAAEGDGKVEKPG